MSYFTSGSALILFLALTLCRGGPATVMAHDAAELPAATKKLLATLRGTSNVRDLGRQVGVLFRNPTLPVIRLLKAHEDHGVALRAGWEEVLSAGLKRRGQDEGRLGVDPTAAARFLGFVEGRLRITLPSWWEEMVKGAGAVAPSTPVIPGSPINRPYHDVTFRGLNLVMPAEMQLRAHGEGAIVSVGTSEMLLPPAIARKCAQKNYGRCLTGTMSKELCLLAPHTPMTCSYPLICVDRASGRKLWQSEVWDAGNTGGSGLWHEYVAVRIREQEVFVIGAGGFSFHIEAFELGTGRNRFRFATKYWFEDK